MRQGFALLLYLACAVTPSTAHAGRFRVPEDIPAIGAAVAVAAAGDTIDVGPGTYFDNVVATVPMAILGRLGASSTTVDGQHSGPVLQVVGGVIDGLTLRNGEALRGGGVYVTGTVPTQIANCVITGNHAEYGGGIAQASHAALTINQCTVTGNVAGAYDNGNGGGVYLGSITGPVTIADSNIDGNGAGDSGGALYEDDTRSTSTINNCTFNNNVCHVAGGGVYLRRCEFTFNLVWQNHSDSFGGGMVATGTNVISNTIVDNTIDNGLPDAASGVLDVGCNMHHNLLVNNKGFGGGAGLVVRGGALFCNDAWNNDGADYFIAAPADTTAGGNISADPMLCEAPQFYLSMNSPCLTSSCGQVGAFGQGCVPTEIRRVSWGALKARYR